MKRHTPGHVKRAKKAKKKRLRGIPIHLRKLHWLTIDDKPVAGFVKLSDAEKQKADLPSRTRHTKRVRIERG